MVNQHPTPTLAEIAAAQAARFIPAFDRAYPAQVLARLQQLYAHRKGQLQTLGYLFEEGNPELTLRGETQQLTLRGELVADTYAVLRDALDKALVQLEKELVQAHLDIAQCARDVASDYADETDYVPHILALCQPAPAGLSREQIAEREAAAHARADAEAAIEEPTNATERSRAAHELGSLCLWHANFPAGLVRYLAHNELFRLTADLPHDLRTFNGGRPLDAHDYAYVADVLRAALAGTLTAAQRLRLERALTWVESAAA